MTKLIAAVINSVFAVFILYCSYMIYTFFHEGIIAFQKICGKKISHEQYWGHYGENLGGLDVLRVGMMIMGYQLVIRTFLMFSWLLVNKFPECGVGSNVLF